MKLVRASWAEFVYRALPGFVLLLCFVLAGCAATIFDDVRELQSDDALRSICAAGADTPECRR